MGMRHLKIEYLLDLSLDAHAGNADTTFSLTSDGMFGCYDIA